MKRSNYAGGGSGRGVPAQKAPLPFNLPSKKLEAGYDTSTGGIAAAGAKWASAHPSSVDASHNSPQQNISNPGQSPPPPAWGGAGMRTRAPPTQTEFPTLRNAPQHSLPAAAGGSFVRTIPQPPSPPAITAPIFPSVADDHDWAEDDEGIDLAIPIALPEVLVVQPTALPPSGPPQHVAEVYAIEEDAPEQRRGPSLDSRNVTIQSSPRILQSPQHISMAERQNIEQQKDRMKAKAESAHEAWLRAEEERVRGQRERAAEKLRALEMKLGASATPESRSDEKAWSRGVTQKKNEPPPPIVPKVLLRRPVQKEVPQKDAVSAEVVATAPARTVKLEQRKRNGPPLSGDTRQRGRNRDVKPYDGPLENETREHWLGRRRTMTETRDAVRNIIDICIHRAVYGYSQSGRRRGSSRKNSGRDRTGRAHVAHSAINPIVDIASTSDKSSQGVRSAHAYSNSNVRRRHRGSLVDERERSSSYKTQKAAAEPSVGSSSSNTLHSSTEVITGDGVESLSKNVSARAPRKAKKRGGKNSERAKRERRDSDVRRPSVSGDTPTEGDSTAAPSLGRSHSNANSSDRSLRPLHSDRSRAENWRSSAWSNNSGPRVSNGLPEDSVSTRSVGAGSDAGVVGETTDFQKSGAGRGTTRRNRKRNGKNERIKRERQQHFAASTSAAPPAPTFRKTVVFGPYVHEVLPSLGRGAGGAKRDDTEDSSAWKNRPAQPTSFDDISRAFSNSKGLPLLGAPIIPAVPVAPFIPPPSESQSSAAVKGGSTWAATSTPWTGVTPAPQVNKITTPEQAPNWTPFRGGEGEKDKPEGNSTPVALESVVAKDGAQIRGVGGGGRRGRNRRGRGKRNGGGRRKASIQETTNGVNPKTEVKDPGAAPLESTGEDPVDVGSTSTSSVPSTPNGQPRGQRNGGRGRGGDRRGSRSRFNGSRRKVRNRRPPPTARTVETKTENHITQQSKEELVTKPSPASP